MNILQRTKRRRDDWIGHILCRNCLLKHVERKIEEKIEVMGRRRRRRKQILVDFKENKGYLKLKDEALGHTLWKIRFRKKLWTCSKTDNTVSEWMNEWMNKWISTLMSNCDEKRLKVIFVSWNRARNSCRRAWIISAHFLMPVEFRSEWFCFRKHFVDDLFSCFAVCYFVHSNLERDRYRMYNRTSSHYPKVVGKAFPSYPKTNQFQTQNLTHV